MTRDTKGGAELLSRLRDEWQADLARQRRLSIQYGLGALAIALAGLLLDQAGLGLLVWALFALWLVMRLRAARVHAAAVSQALHAAERHRAQRDTKPD